MDKHILGVAYKEPGTVPSTVLITTDPAPLHAHGLNYRKASKEGKGNTGHTGKGLRKEGDDDLTRSPETHDPRTAANAHCQSPVSEQMCHLEGQPRGGQESHGEIGKGDTVPKNLKHQEIHITDTVTSVVPIRNSTSQVHRRRGLRCPLWKAGQQQESRA